MKKFFLIAALAVSAVAANAQTWVGGSIGYNTSNSKINDVETAKTSKFEIKPEIGYNLSDKWAVAIALGYTHQEIKGDKTVNSFTVNPYARYTFVKSGNFSAFLDGGIFYSTDHYQGNEKNLNTFGVKFNPGIAYAISPKVGLVAHVGELLYANGKQGDYYKTNTFNIGLTNAISFGAYVNL